MKKILLFLFSFLLVLTPIFVFSADTSTYYTISCTPGEDASKEMRINWHTNENVTGTYVVYTEKTDTTWSDSKIAQGEAVLNTSFTRDNCSGETFNQNGAVLSNLKSGTEYMYKITNGTTESEIRYFKTGSQSFSFVWISDFHAYYDDARRLNNATSVINDAISLNGGVDFILSTGDTIAHGGTYKWWKQVSEASWMKNYMFATTLGNHDWMTKAGTLASDGSSHLYLSACQNAPKNGYTGQENVCYYFYYGDCLFVVMNTEEYSQAQKDWVCDVLDNNKAQYIFLMQHYEAFTANGSKKSSGYSRWKDVCDKYGVDIFFTGNSHAYVRSNPIYNDKPSTDPSKGTVYMVAPSSDGDRGVAYTPFSQNTDILAKGWANGTSTCACSLVTVSQDGVITKLINKGGEVLDQAVISAKRGPTERSYKDLKDFNKDLLEGSFALQLNTKDMKAPRLKYDVSCYDGVRSIKVYNKDTNKVYYDGPIKSSSKYMELSNVDKGELTVCIEINYFDDTVKTIELPFSNVYKWGAINKEIIANNNGVFTLSWNELVNAARLSNIEIYVNDSLFKTVELGVQTCELPTPEYGVKNKVKFIVKDVDGDPCYVKEFEYNLDLKKYVVKFIGINGGLIEEQTLEDGSNIVYPNAPVIEGYTFKEWDSKEEKVSKDLVINAVYQINVYTLKFYDNENNLLATEQVEYGKTCEAPKTPEILGLEFVKWDVDFSNVKDNLDIKAIYDTKELTVKFVDSNDEIISQMEVKFGEDAKVPEAPTIEGKVFKSWDKDFTKVKENLVVKAQYETLLLKVKFIGNDGNTISEVEVEYGKDAVAPEAPAVNGMMFKSWSKELTNVKENLDIQAIYEEVQKQVEPKGCNSASIIFSGLMLLGLYFIRKKEY